MRRIMYLSTFLLLAATLPAVAGEPTPTPAPALQPTITVAPAGAPAPTPVVPAGPAGTLEMKERAWDAGNIERGGALNHTFVYKNVGKHDLTIDAKPGCGCTVVDYDKVLAPGKEGKLTASLNTDHFKGPTTKSITFSTNDPANARIMLEIKANVSVPIEVLPSDSISLNAKAGEEKSQEISFVASDGKAFDIVSMKDVPGIKTKIEAVLDAGAKPAKAASGTAKPLASGSAKYKLTVKSAADAAVGRTFQTLDVATSHPKVPSIPIRVSLLIQGEVEVVPERVYLQSIPPVPAAEGAPANPPAVMTQAVKLRKAEGAPFKVDGVTSSDPDFATLVKTVKEGHEYDVEIKYTGKPGRGMVSAQVTVKTNEAKQAQIVIPVAART